MAAPVAALVHDDEAPEMHACFDMLDILSLSCTTVGVQKTFTPVPSQHDGHVDNGDQIVLQALLEQPLGVCIADFSDAPACLAVLNREHSSQQHQANIDEAAGAATAAVVAECMQHAAGQPHAGQPHAAAAALPVPELHAQMEATSQQDPMLQQPQPVPQQQQQGHRERSQQPEHVDYHQQPQQSSWLTISDQTMAAKPPSPSANSPGGCSA